MRDGPPLGRLTTHVLDTALGRPAAGIPIRLTSLGHERHLLCETSTNADGRCDSPLLEGNTLTPGLYELTFEVGAYFAARGGLSESPPFLDHIVLRFGIADPDQHIHVPLLISPFGYTTYRGS